MLASESKIHYELKTERLSLEPYRKEYVEQYHSWLVEDPELLFLTGSQSLNLEEEMENQKSWLSDPKKYTFLIFKDGGMIGDINLFFSDWIDKDQAEINVMIAKKEERGKGYGAQVLRAIEMFARGVYGKTEIIAKIKEDNKGSKRLFEKEGYELVNHSDHFKEDEYKKIIKMGTIQMLKEQYQLRAVRAE